VHLVELCAKSSRLASASWVSFSNVDAMPPAADTVDDCAVHVMTEPALLGVLGLSDARPVYAT
jgi:hypothetical protein